MLETIKRSCKYAFEKVKLKIMKKQGKISQEEYSLLKKSLIAKSRKLGVAYNLFDGEELLIASIKSIRNCVDYIVVVYQNISNFGDKSDINLEEFLNNLKTKGLIEESYYYEPTFGNVSQHYNEIKKRDIGLELVKKAGCDYFLSMDTDEFYEEEQFNTAKAYIFKNDIECSAVSIIEYLKKPFYQIVSGYTFAYGVQNSEMYNFYVPFIIKIYKLKKQYHGTKFFPCLTDPTRTINSDGKFYLFPKHIIAMHHMSTIRRNLHKKYANSTLRNDNVSELTLYNEQLKQDVLNFDFVDNCSNLENIASFRGMIVRKVEDKFEIGDDFIESDFDR